MAIITIDETCPHCIKEHAMFKFIAETPLRENFFSLAFQCQSCLRLLIAEVARTGTSSPTFHANNSAFPLIVNKSNKFKVTDLYPEAPTIESPNSTPERASKFFIEAKEDFARGRYETSAMNCRKVIDIATKTLHVGAEDKLVRRISALRQTGLITQEMADWAHIVRIDTNGAVHSDEEFESEEVDQLLKFTEVFLTYAFTLPALVKEKREIAH
ncbi:DUF4145 domain-containing protein [Pantoea sp. ME81]|uniref:DUF4145 domain-containing protein n=1 Tax=Pantoea sp. ME81 TaxID=2743935 RepID=UPI0015F52157|nr:DUF4145 domain-containing protein [Pantoea sp. ME81]